MFWNIICFHVNHMFKSQLVLCFLAKQVVTSPCGQERNDIPSVGELVIKAKLKYLCNRSKGY